MAVNTNNPHGEVRGSIFGNTFTRSKGQQTIRGRVGPVNPRTSQQQQARSEFMAVAKTWQGLPLATKQAWNSFADLYYVPRIGANLGQFSGYNAFCACRQRVMAAYFAQSTFNVLWGTRITPDNPTILNLPFDQDPPAIGNISPELLNVPDPPIGIYLTYALTLPTEKCIFTVKRFVTPWPCNTNDWISTNGNSFGFAVFFSSPMSYEGGTPRTEFNQLIGTTGFMTNVAGTLDTEDTARFEMDISQGLKKFKTRIQTGQTIRTSIIIYDTAGTSSVLGSSDLKVNI